VTLRPVLVNRYEEAADKEIRRACERNAARVYAKVRLGDAVELRGSGLSDEEFGYATRAHLDFLVCDTDHFALFVVEMDGRATHANARRVARDRMKDSICYRLCLPLLRLDNRALRRFGPRFRLLGWLVEVWFLKQAFDAAQERGEIPPFEPFDPYGFIERDPGGTWRHSYHVTAPVIIRLQQLEDAGHIPSAGREAIELHTHGDDEDAVAYQVLPVHHGFYLFTKAACRSLSMGIGAAPVEIASDLALLELGEQVEQYLGGEPVAVDRRELARVRERSSGPGWIRQGRMLDDIPSPY
jgi:hypothetical protein